jgi:hypothetical protein
MSRLNLDGYRRPGGGRAQAARAIRVMMTSRRGRADSAGSLLPIRPDKPALLKRLIDYLAEHGQ